MVESWRSKTMKKNLLKTISLAAAALVMSGQAQAQTQTQPTLYVSSHVNYTKVTDLPVNFTEVGVGTRLGAQVHKNFAAELGYDDFGKQQSGAVGAKIRALTLAGVARVEVAPNTWVRGSVGMIRTKANIVAGTQRIKRYESEPFVGVGIEQVLRKNMSAVAEFRYAQINQSNARNANLGLKFTF